MGENVGEALKVGDCVGEADATQVVSLVKVQAWVSTVPTGHVIQSAHALGMLVPALNVFARQGVQTRSALAEQAVESRSPGGQVVEQVVQPEPLLYCPARHAEQNATLATSPRPQGLLSVGVAPVQSPATVQGLQIPSKVVSLL